MKKTPYLATLLLLLSCGKYDPSVLGLNGDKLKELDNKPHGVSTMTDMKEKKMDPINYSVNDDLILDIIKKSLAIMDNKLISEKHHYLHYEYYTTLGFTDDVEFYVDSIKKLIHYRSQSRVGRKDFGTNRKRMEKVIAILNKSVN